MNRPDKILSSVNPAREYIHSMNPQTIQREGFWEGFGVGRQGRLADRPVRNEPDSAQLPTPNCTFDCRPAEHKKNERQARKDKAPVE